MPSLQIRNLPEALYRVLADRAKRSRRSLAQQALIELERLTREEGASRRSEAVSALRARACEQPPRAVSLDPVDVVREDRQR